MREQLVSLSAGVEFLKQLGLNVEVIDGHTIAINKARYRVLTRQTVPSPALVQSQSKAQTVWLVPKLTKGLRLIAGASPNTCFVGVIDQEVWLAGKSLTKAEPGTLRTKTRGKIPWARFALMRALAKSSRPRTQTELALSLGITQPAISNALSTMNQLVERKGAGWVAKDFDLLANEFLASYAGPGGVTVGWFSLEPVIKQAQSVLASHPETLLSADAAADQIAPWRLPRTAVVYSPKGLDLSQLGFTEAPAESATLKLVVPSDPHLWQLAGGTKANLADGLQVAYDLSQSFGPDNLEAAERLLRQLRNQWREDKD